MVVENAAEAIALMDLWGNFLFVNPAFARMLQARPEDLMGRNVSQVAPVELAWEALSRFEELEKTGNGYVREAGFTVNGRDLWYMTSVVPVKDGQGRVTAALTLTTDVTHLKKTQEELKSAQDSLEQRVEERTQALNEAVDQLRAEARVKRMGIEALQDSEAMYCHT